MVLIYCESDLSLLCHLYSLPCDSTHFTQTGSLPPHCGLGCGPASWAWHLLLCSPCLLWALLLPFLPLPGIPSRRTSTAAPVPALRCPLSTPCLKCHLCPLQHAWSPDPASLFQRTFHILMHYLFYLWIVLIICGLSPLLLRTFQGGRDLCLFCPASSPNIYDSFWHIIGAQ